MHEIGCSEVWGGIQDENVDATTAALATSLYSAACDGGKGGDIYYYSVCPNDNLTRVAIADVVGHGEKVSTVSQWLYEGLHKHMNSGDGVDILSELNALACERGLEALTTASVASFFKPLSQLRFSYAGHPPMLFRQHAGDRWRPLALETDESGPRNLPLGIDLAVRYDEQRVEVAGGDRLLLYTDGVLETPDSQGRLFGAEHLTRILDDHATESLPAIKTAVLSALRDHAGGDPRHDDVTLMAIEVRD